MDTELLIVGAGPFGLSMAARARAMGVEHRIVGRPMSFWRERMPAGMLLRSGCDWHLDPTGRCTLARFVEEHGQRPEEVEPLSLELYLDYAEWFTRSHGIEVDEVSVTHLARDADGFAVRFGDGASGRARRVLLALGFAPFAHTPDELRTTVPASRLSHTSDPGALAGLAGRRVLIVGGRQSAFESACLLAEAGAPRVDVCLRHETPEFTTSDWSWVGGVLARIEDDPDGFRALSPAEREALDRRFWVEGRLKLEPWLAPRLEREEIRVRPGTRVVGAEEGRDGLLVRLDDGTELEVDHVLCATGYRVDLGRVGLLDGSLREGIECRDGFPVLGPTLETTVPGLHVTSLPATRDFGLFFAFTAAVRTSAALVARALDA